MFLRRLIKLVFLMVCLLSCQQKNNKKNHKAKAYLESLITNAIDNNIPGNERLVNAFMADSIALAINDIPSQITSKKAIATIYVKLDSSLQAINYFLMAAELAKKSSDSENLGIVLNNIGIIYNEKSEYDSALKYYHNANEIFNKTGDQEHIAQALVNIAIVYKIQGNFKEAFRLCMEAAKIIENTNSVKDLAYIYTTIGNILRELNKLQDALHYHNLALTIRIKEQDSVGIASSLNNIGNVYRAQKNYTKALVNYKNSLIIKERNASKKAIATTIDNIAEVYSDLGQYSNAEAYFKKVLALRNGVKDKDGYLTASNKLIKLYLAENKLKNAELLANHVDSIVSDSGFLKQRLNNAVMRADIYTRFGKYKLSAKYALEALALKERLSNDNVTDTVFLLNEKYKTQQKERELFTAKQFQAVQSEKIDDQWLLIILLIIVLCILSIVSFLLFRSNRVVKKANERIEILMKELNHRVKNNLQIVSDMLHLQKDIINDSHQMPMIQSAINRVESMNIIHTLLYQKGYSGIIELKNFVTTLMENLVHAYEFRSTIFNINLNIQKSNISVDKAIPLGLILNELITNIFKYAEVGTSSPLIEIIFTQKNNNCILEIRDNCKKWDIDAARTKKSGLGLFLVETLTRQIKGKWKQTSINSETIHTIEFSN